jgi:hypothetical protein
VAIVASGDPGRPPPERRARRPVADVVRACATGRVLPFFKEGRFTGI